MLSRGYFEAKFIEFSKTCAIIRQGSMERERQHRIDRRQFLKGAVEMAAGGILIFESVVHLTEGVLAEQGVTSPHPEAVKTKDRYSKFYYGVDVVKAGIGSGLTYIGFDRINSPESRR